MTDSVTYGVAFTRNMTNYESLKINVGATFDVLDGETVEEAKERVKQFVNSTFTEEVDEVESDIRNVRTAADERAAKK